jgi:hypothetical protein
MKICSVEWCDREVVAKGVCAMHYHRLRKNLDLNAPHRYETNRYETIKICKIEWCHKRAKSLGFCPMHYVRFLRGVDLNKPPKNDPNRPTICSVNECDLPISSHGFCCKHAHRYVRHGNPLITKKAFRAPEFCSIEGCDNPGKAHDLCNAHNVRRRNGQDLNPPLIKRRKSLNNKDKGIYELAYYKDQYGYMRASFKRKMVLQHRVVWEMHNGRKLEKFENIHHINGIRDDNRIENLELWTKPQPIGQRPEDLVAWVIEHYREDVLRAIDTRLELDLQPQRQQP